MVGHDGATYAALGTGHFGSYVAPRRGGRGKEVGVSCLPGSPGRCIRCVADDPGTVAVVGSCCGASRTARRANLMSCVRHHPWWSLPLTRPRRLVGARPVAGRYARTAPSGPAAATTGRASTASASTHAQFDTSRCSSASRAVERGSAMTPATPGHPPRHAQRVHACPARSTIR